MTKKISLKKNIFISLSLLVIVTIVTLIVLNFLYPPNLNRYHQSSPMLLDEKNQLISCAISKDEYWRFPIQSTEVDPQFLKMLIAFEDKRFYYHPGIDPIAMLRASLQYFRNNRVVSGGSTLTLQVVRLLNPRPRTLINKIKECFVALQLECYFSKKEILSMYLSLAPYGGNIEGIRAASFSYFGKEPQKLTLSESALLIAIPQKPNQNRPDVYSETAKQNRNKVLQRMHEQGVISKQAMFDAYEDRIMGNKKPFPRMALHVLHSTISKDRSRDNRTQDMREINFSMKAAVMQTTLNGDLQRQLELYCKQQLTNLEPAQTISAIIVDNKTRQIKAYVGSADFHDAARSGQVDIIRSVRSPGSTLKPFIYGLAFDDGLVHPETIIDDSPINFGQYAPTNLKDVFHGQVTIRKALQQSLNIPAVALLDKIGPARFMEHLKTCRVQLKFEHQEINPSLPIALGGVGIRLWDLMNLYVALANQGEFKAIYLLQPHSCHPQPPLLVGDTASSCHPRVGGDPGISNDLTVQSNHFMSPLASAHITQILAEAPPPDGFVDSHVTLRSSAIAFKTGTSFGYRDAWAMGYNGDYTVGVWVGKPDGTPSPNQLGRAIALPLLFHIFHLMPESNTSSLLDYIALAENSANQKNHENINNEDKNYGNYANKILLLKQHELPESHLRFKIKKSTARNTSELPFSNRSSSHSNSNNLNISSFKLIFPKDGITIPIEYEENNENNAKNKDNKKSITPIPISLWGGTPPFYVLENGHPLPSYYSQRTIKWSPQSAGFVQLTILDSAGGSASINILLK